ncbi:MAG: hypothetical protein ACYCZM_04890 [Acidimicrobiales bacterium]
MTISIWAVVLFLHVLAAVFWVGGQIMLAVVVLPLLRRQGDPVLTRTLAVATGRRFAMITSAGLFPVLVVTGLLLAWHNGVRLSSLGTTAYGRTLLLKVVIVAVTFALTVAHGVVARRLPGSAGRALAVATLALSVGIVLLAATLASLPSPR